MSQQPYLVAEIRSRTEPLPEGQRVPFEWDCSPIGKEGTLPPATLTWDQKVGLRGKSRLRLTVGIDVRETKRISVLSGATQKNLGEFDIRYAPVFQTFEIFLSEEQTALALSEGAILQMTEGNRALWVFNGKSGTTSVPEVLRPHLLMEESEAGHSPKSLDGFLRQMASLASIQPFGWMEGCVLDGLLDLEECFPGQGFRESAKAHLDLFIQKNGALIYEGPKSNPLDGSLASIEETLMAAFIARFFPGHPSIQIIKDFWASQRTADGAILDHGLLSAEGSYTIGYPLAVLSLFEKSEILAHWALDQVRARQKGLVVGETIYLRLHADGTRSFPNWSRGVAWYFLGLVRTLGVLGKRDDVSDLLGECRRLSAWLLSKRNSENLWNCFI
ncbi:MAG: hypothetical protein JNM63_16845, partial [Spirochaetia bacterium]|nr:hypothetical protein [Spirochaetia bacterium]